MRTPPSSLDDVPDPAARLERGDEPRLVPEVGALQRPILPRLRRTWAIGLGLAIAAPISAHALLSRQIGSLEERLSQQAGVACTISSIEAGLTGALRLRDVRLGDLLQAEAVEASMSWAGLLSGAMAADEIRVEGPRLALAIDASGDSDLARTLARLAAARRDAGASGEPRATAAPRAPRRIVVSEGELTVTIAGVAQLRAQGVELRPQPGGVRAISRRIEITAEAPLPAGRGLAAVQLGLGHAAADLTLPRMTVERLIAVGGSGSLRVGEAELPIASLSLARLSPQQPLTAQLTVDDRGVPRAVELRLVSGPTPALQLRSAHLPLWPLAAAAPPWLDVSDAHLEGELAISRGAALGLTFDGHLERARVDHPVIASDPVELAGDLDATVRLQRGAAGQEGAAELQASGRFRVGSAIGTASVLARRGAAISAVVEVTLQPAPCAELLASVPRAMRAPLEGMALAGQLGGSLHLTVDTSAPLGEGVELTAEPEGSCRVTAEPPRADVTQLLGVHEHVFPDGSRAAVGAGLGAGSGTGAGTWLELRGLPGHVAGAFVAAEDARFFGHRGFDVGQIARSLEIDLREGRLARGGSTISQQLIKNAFLDGKRSMARKLNEAILTWRLEARLDKRDILERYLNIIELGPSIYGLAAAAQHWFGVAPRQLGVRQAAFLAALTPEPTTMTRRIVSAGGLDRASAARVETVLRAMKRQGLIAPAELEQARRAELDFRREALKPAATGAAAAAAAAAQ
jgi:Transglycosylase